MWKDKRLLKMGLVPQEIVTFEKYQCLKIRLPVKTDFAFVCIILIA